MSPQNIRRQPCQLRPKAILKVTCGASFMIAERAALIICYQPLAIPSQQQRVSLCSVRLLKSIELHVASWHCDTNYYILSVALDKLARDRNLLKGKATQAEASLNAKAYKPQTLNVLT